MSSATRKLAAIIFTDIAGFTVLSAQDEEKALELILKQRELLKPIVEQHDGKWLKEIGDGLLLSFSSTKQAVKCAIKIQQITKEIDELNLRIGIHQGDILEQNGDIFGDDVNITSRIEPFAAIGGVAISSKVHKDISSSPEITTKLIGKPRLKGVSQDVKVYCITSHDLPQTVLSDVKAKLEPKPLWIRLAAPVATTITLFCFYFLIIEPEVPSVGILYMENLGTEEDEFWARGITEDVIIEVASAGLIRVAPMQEIVEFIKSTSPLINIAKKLQVKYLLTSSIHKRNGSFDLRAQLIDAKSGKSVYAGKWSESLGKASTITSVLAENILDELGVATKRELTKHYQINPEAYELYLRGKYRWDKREDRQDIEITFGLLEKAIELDPNLLLAKLHLGKSNSEYGKHDQAMEIFQDCIDLSKTLDNKLVLTISLMSVGNILITAGDYDGARDHYHKALKITQDIGDKLHEGSILMNIGNVYYYTGDLETALSYYQKSLMSNLELENLRGEGESYFNIGSIYEELFAYKEALSAYNKSYKIFYELDENSKILYPLIGIGMVTDELGDHDSAIGYLEEALEIAKNIHDEGNEITSMLYIGDIYHKTGQLDKALEYWQLALTKSEAIKDSYNCYFAHQWIGELMIQKNNYDKAIYHFKAACAMWNELDDPSYYLESLSYWALAELKSGNLDSVDIIVYQIENILKETEISHESIINLNWNLYQVFMEMDDVFKARNYLERAYIAINNLTSQFKESKQKESFISNDQTRREIIDSYEQLNNRKN